MNLTTERQGKAIVELGGVDILVMMPDGQVSFAADRADAERQCKRWFKKHAKADVSIGEIEWRDG